MLPDNSNIGYNYNVEDVVATEYPMLHGTTYLDHGGATIYAKSLIESVAANMISNLYGNPHSASTPAKLSGRLVDETRIKTLQFFGADPEHFDLVFVANATAAMKLVMDSFKDLGHANTEEGGGFNYYYHVDSHTSLVGIREAAGANHHCFRDDTEVERWLADTSNHTRSAGLGLFAYPGQSNMNGRRLPLSWPGILRRSNSPVHRDTYSLFDAAALATTAPLNPIFKDPDSAPDFTSVSFYKIFGYPDIGGLIIRKASGHILSWGRKYFGGGTVEGVTVLSKKPLHISRQLLHESLEDGTLPFHDIIALSLAIDTHERLYGPNPMSTISKHATFLGKRLYDSMASLYHSNGTPLCEIYKQPTSTYGDPLTQGSTIAFNILRSDGSYVPYTSGVETLANKRNIYLRAGQLCNPGGVATYLGFSDWQLKRLLASGHRCGSGMANGTEVVGGKVTGVVRVSLGAMTTIGDVERLLGFLREEFLTPPISLLDRAFQLPLPVRPREETEYFEDNTRSPQIQWPIPTPVRSAPSRPQTTDSVDPPTYHDNGRVLTAVSMNYSADHSVRTLSSEDVPRSLVPTDFSQMLDLRIVGSGEGEKDYDRVTAVEEKNGIRRLWKGRTRRRTMSIGA